MTDITRPFLEGVLVYPVDDESVLLATKTRKIAVGRRSGFGGSFEGNENAEECCVREVPEECGLIIEKDSLEKMGIVDFHNTREDGSAFLFRVHVFFVRKWAGEPRDGDGMIDPAWHNKKDMPWDQMTPDNIYWLGPMLLEGKKFVASVTVGPGQRELLCEPTVTEVSSFQ